MDDKVAELVTAFLAALARAGYEAKITNHYEAGHLEAVIVLPLHHWRKGTLVRKDTK